MLLALIPVVVTLAAAPSPPAPADAGHAKQTLRVRALVDAGYGHDKQLESIFAEAATLFAAQLDCGLTIVDTQPWKPSPAASKNVRAGLAELERDNATPGEGVDLVIAFITKPPKATDDYHQLGNSHVFGRQSIVRAVDDPHEEALILAHHIAHNIAGVHAAGAGTLLSTTYAAAQKDTPFNEDQLALLKPGLAYVLAKNDKDRASAAAQVTRELEKRQQKLDAASVSELKTTIDELAGKASSELVLPPEQARVVNDAVASMNAGDAAGAFAKLKALADKPDAAPVIQSLACRLVSDEKVKDADAARCDRAMKANNDLDTADAAVRFALKRNDDAAIKRAFAEAKARLDRVKQPGADVDELAALAHGTGRLALAEAALAKSTGPDAAKQKADIVLERRRSGVPPGMLSYEDEATLLPELAALQGIDNADKRSAAVDRDIARWGEVPALLVERCSLQIDKETYHAAEATCEKALAKYDEFSAGHVATGMAYIDDELPNKGIPHFEKAIALDPTYGDAYVNLWSAYKTIGKRDEQKKLEAAYQKVFGKPLPH